MKIQQVVITAKDHVELQEATLDEAALGPDDILVETERTFISAGTELANYTGVEPRVYEPGSWCCYPWRAGYANLGIILAVGSAVKRLQVGQRVFTFGPHASAHIYDTKKLAMVVPPDIALDDAVAARMADVAITALDVAQPGYHRWVAVFGLGMVGNLAAQMFQIAGARVIGIDPSERRRSLARACGIRCTIAGDENDTLQAIKQITNDKMVATAVDAVGNSRVIMRCLDITAPFGEIIILGSPRTPVTGDLTELFSTVHRRWITIKGALEWRIPHYHQMDNEPSHAKKHTTILDWIRAGRLKLQPLITHRLPPNQIKQAYDGLLENKEEYVGVVLEWKA